ncbi:hypothetical protein [Paenibacillus sp. BJ-4]|uniref:hypothetical protein n=1 Tax=Paenibacillus sp. BJ-4 TaxID=2878097 RepID=UPI001CEFE2DD|nr:hypothetical protein [Paenibacillus sp. BJ-4]
MAKRDDRTTELHDYDFEPSLQNAETNWENLTEGPDTPLENIPDADELAPGSTVDPSAPAEFLHGTDLLNGSDGDED